MVCSSQSYVLDNLECFFTHSINYLVCKRNLYTRLGREYWPHWFEHLFIQVTLPKLIHCTEQKLKSRSSRFNPVFSCMLTPRFCLFFPKEFPFSCQKLFERSTHSELRELFSLLDVRKPNFFWVLQARKMPQIYS